MHIVIHTVCAVVILILLAVAGTSFNRLDGLRARCHRAETRADQAEAAVGSTNAKIEAGIASRNRRIAEDAKRIEALQKELAAAQRQRPVRSPDRSQAWRDRIAAYQELLEHSVIVADWDYVSARAAAGEIEKIEKTGEQEVYVHLSNGFRVNATVPPGVDPQTLVARSNTVAATASDVAPLGRTIGD